MDLRWLNLIFIALVGLTACGSEPKPVDMDRRFLSGEYLEAAKADLQSGIQGEVLDQHEWIFGEQKLFTILSREQEPGTEYKGVFLRQYDLSGQKPTLMWTYQDSIFCADAGAVTVENHSAGLRPVRLLGDSPKQFVLSYTLGCADESEVGRNIVVVDVVSGTPAVRLFGTPEAVYEAEGLHNLPADTRHQLLAMLRD